MPYIHRYNRVTVNGKRQLEHRAVWERVHGIKIPVGYVIHHIDGNSKNNNPDNLKLMTCGEHNKLHKKLKSEGTDPVDSTDPAVIYSRESRRKYHEINKDKERENYKQYYLLHKEEIKTRKAKYAVENRDKIRAHEREYRKDHKEEIAAKSRLRYLSNREQNIKKSQKYRSEHLEERKAYDHNYHQANKEKERILHAKYHREHINEIHKKQAIYRENHRAIKRATDNLRNAIRKGYSPDVIAKYIKARDDALKNPSGK